MSAASPGVQNDTTSLRIPAYLLPLKITLKYTGRPAVFMFIRGEQLAKASISNQPLFPFNIIPTPTLYRSSLLQGREENFIRFHTHTQPDISEFLHGSIFASCQFLLLSCKKKKKKSQPRQRQVSLGYCTLACTAQTYQACFIRRSQSRQVHLNRREAYVQALRFFPSCWEVSRQIQSLTCIKAMQRVL